MLDIRESFMRSIRYLSLMGGISVLAACGGGSSGVGNQSDEDPVASAEIFGATQDISGIVEVRSGKEVLLSGFNSDGVDDPLLSFSWQQVDDSGYSVDLYERAANTAAFTAPAVPLDNLDGVMLEFQLTVTDGDGKTASDTVAVNIRPAYDLNQFLLNPRVDERYVIIVAAPEGTDVAEDIPFSLTVNVATQWEDRLGNNQSVEVSSTTLTGTVSSGTAPATTDTSNAYFIQPIPLLDADEVNLSYQGDDRSGRLEFEKVETALMMVNMNLTQQVSGDIRIYLAREVDDDFELVDTTGAVVDEDSLSFSDEWLRQNLQVESRRSANNYYDCIDPNGEATTLTDWIEYAGFNEYPDSVVHTSYVNNYDLNFGRDMYVRRDDNGNVYTYVTNYPSLENIFSGRNEFAIVVMEYSPAPTGNCGDGTFADDATGKKIVKFYSYVPDEVTGEYVRAPSMNFDGRGERMVPGVCVACHYGDTNADQFNMATLGDIDAGAADLDSSFIPWDLDAFLYTGGTDDEVVDPVYTSDPNISPETTSSFTREAQEEAFRQQNQMVLDTFTHDPENLGRFEIPIKLLHGWYGNSEAVENLNFGTPQNPLTEEESLALQAQVSTLPEATFDGTYVQSGWVGQETLYHEVYSRNCRLCHAQVSNQAINFDTYQEFIGNEKLQSYIYQQGIMPLSRLTMDRFWVSFYGETAPAEVLRNHMNNDADPTNDIPVGVLPGYPVALMTPSRNPELSADVLMDFDGNQLFDGSSSLFSNAFEWSVDNSFVSEENKFVYQGTNPGDTATVSLVVTNTDDGLASQTITRTIEINDNQPQADGVPTATVNEGESVAINIFESLCPGESPDSLACRSTFGDIRTGDVPTISLSDGPTNGSIVITDAALGIVQFTSTAPSENGSGIFGFTLSDSFGEDSDEGRVSVTVNALAGPVVNPDTCTVDAINYTNEGNFPIDFGSAPCLDPAANDSSVDGFNLTVVAVSAPSNPDASVSVTNGVVSYEPARFSTAGDSFTYTVQDDSVAQRESTETVTVTVNPTQTFSSLTSGSGVFGNVCIACHAAGNLDGAPVWQTHGNTVLAATNTDLMPYETAEITLAEPTTRDELLTSGLFLNGCNVMGASHTGGNVLCNNGATAPLDISELNSDGLSILRWLEEGGANN